LLGKFARLGPSRLPRQVLTARVCKSRWSGRLYYIHASQLLCWHASTYHLRLFPIHSIDSFLADTRTKPWTMEDTRDWMAEAPAGSNDLSPWPPPSLGCWHPPSTISMNGTYGRYTKDTMDNNGIPVCSSPTCHCLLFTPPYVPPMSHGHLDRYSFVCFLCDDSQHHVFSLDALSLAPFQMLSAHYLSTHLCFFPICQHLFEVTDLTTHGYSFWRFQLPDALYMLLSRLYRKVNPFRSDLLLLLLLKHRRDSKKWDSRFSESPPTRGSAGAWWLNG
jgi:hypothetical protein